jgi:hypothetical protein
LSDNHGGIHDAGDYQDDRQQGIAGIAGLICNSECDPGYKQTHKSSGLAGRQYEKSAGHREKAGYRHVIKKRCHPMVDLSVAPTRTAPAVFATMKDLEKLLPPESFYKTKIEGGLSAPSIVALRKYYSITSSARPSRVATRRETKRTASRRSFKT